MGIIPLIERGIIPSIEQKEILGAVVNKKSLRINALAGTGKTTTLVMVADVLPEEKILCMVFTKANEIDMKKKFRPGVTIKTTHSIAYQIVKKWTNINLENISPNYRPSPLNYRHIPPLRPHFPFQ